MKKLPLLIGTLSLIAAQAANSVSIRSSASVELIEPATFIAESEFDTFEVKKTVLLMAEQATITTEKPKESKDKKVYVQDIPDSKYSFSSVKSDSIQISASNYLNSSGVNVDDFKVKFKGHNVSESLTYDAADKRSDITLSAKLKINSDAKAGYHSPEFEIAVLYE